MKYDFRPALLDIHDKPILQQNSKDPVTIGAAIMEGLLAPRPMEAGGEKCQAFELAFRIRDNMGDCELTLEEATFIKTKIGESCIPLVCGRVTAALEQRE